MNATIEHNNQILSDQIRRKLDVIFKVHNIERQEAEEALKWLMNPTVRPIVGIREFINSPYYMDALDDHGKPITYEGVMEALVELNEGDYS